MQYYPIMLNVEGLPVTVVGGGDVAFRKVTDLLEGGAVVTVIAPEICDGIRSLGGERLAMHERPYAEGDLAGAALVFSATNSPGVNEAVYGEARSRNIFINAVDDPPHCTFIVPSSIRKGDLVVAVSTGGASPAMAARVRREIERSLPEGIEGLLDAMKRARAILMGHRAFATMGPRERGALLKRVAGDDVLAAELAASGDEKAMVRLLERLAGEETSL